MTGVEDATKLVVTFEKCLGLIHQQGWLERFHYPKDRCHADVCGGKSLVDYLGVHFEIQCFPTPLFGRFNGEVRGYMKRVARVRVESPQCLSCRGAIGQNEITTIRSLELIQEVHAVHWVGPRARAD